MKSALVLCDVEEPPADWSRNDWDETISVRVNGESPSLSVGLDGVDAAGVGLSARAWDLVTLASYIYAADQEVIRWTETDVYGLRWKRDMHLVVPVVAPEFWNQPAILEPLRDTLSYVSGDSWDFRFVSGGGRYASRFQLRDPREAAYLRRMLVRRMWDVRRADVHLARDHGSSTDDAADGAEA